MEEKQLTTQELTAKITNPKYLKFLELYPQCKCMISETAKAMGIDDNTVHYWIARNEDFCSAFSSLKKDLDTKREEKYVQKIEDIVFTEEKVPPQTQLLGSFFMLKALNPRYKDKITPDFHISGDIIFQSNIPEIGRVIEVKELPETTGTTVETDNGQDKI